MDRRIGKQGASFIDLILSIGIVVLLFGGIFAVYFSILDSANSIDLRGAATTVLNRHVEIVRNLPYDSVGTVGGIPAGVIPQQQTSSVGDATFSVQTTIRNIDDPFDGTLGGAPGDTAPADYKLVTMVVSCPSCVHFIPLSFTTTIAPKNLESAGKSGSLFINILDAGGIGVPAAAVHVVNASVTPSIDLLDTTNASGVLQLVGVPTSTQSYQIAVAKSGYSSERTYSVGAPSNPNPIKPHATVAEQTVTNVSFLIDRVSAINIISSNALCSAIGNADFSIAGSKLIGTNPDVYKFSTSSQTNASGSRSLASIEWDTYSFSFNDPAYTLAGIIPLNPIIVNPSSTISLRAVLAPAANPSLLVGAVDFSTGAGVAGASVHLSKTGFSQTLTAGHSIVEHTNWSQGAYSSQDGGIDADSVPGRLSLAASASSTYSASSTSWLISNTIDLGGSSSTLYTISWNPSAQAPQTGAGSLTFQLAANNDQTTWNFIGPDGTANTSFAASSAIPTELSGKRYIRYKAFMKTADEQYSPTLNDVQIEFNSICVPPYHVLFANLPAGTYAVSSTAPDYDEATSSVDISSGFQEIQSRLTHQ